MSDARSPSETEAIEKMWRLFNLQAAMAAGGVLGGAFVALLRFH